MQPVNAETDAYYILDFSKNSKVIKSFNAYEDALNFYDSKKDKYDNLVLYFNDDVLLMEYGIARFKTDNSCAYNIEIEGEGKRNINPCFGIDAAYLGSSSDLSEVQIKISDYVGYVDKEMVVLEPISGVTKRPSMYFVKDGVLYHSLKTQFDLDYYTKNYALSTINIVDGAYYSYDGHYFYRDFKMMIDDYRNNTYEHAVNNVYPYYNYFMYLPFRSLSNYDTEAFEDYFYQNLKLNKRLKDYEDENGDGANDVVNQSELYGTIDEFVAYQYRYGNNALLSLALSAHSSAYGKSLEAYEKNNLFSKAAFNSEFERNNLKYREVESSIYAHMRFIMSNKYLNPKNDVYNGGYLGNLKSGLNIEFSNDPYWGEKVASVAYQIDKNMGLLDYKKAKIGIAYDGFYIYDNEDLSSTKQWVNIAPFALNIIGETENAYRVMLDLTENEDATYDYSDNYGYVLKTDIDLVTGENNQIEFKEVNYNPDGGRYYGGDSLDLLIPINQSNPILTPKKDGFIFTEYEVIENDDSTEMHALFKQIQSISVNMLANSVVNYGDNLNLNNYSLTVVYTDNSYDKIPLTYEMLDGYDKYSSGTQTIDVSYCGVNTSFEVLVGDNFDEKRNELMTVVDNVINQYDTNREFELKELMHNLYECRKYDIKVDRKHLIKLDQMMMDYYDDNLTLSIDENRFDASITGFAFFAGANEYHEFDLAIFQNAYRMHLGPVNLKHRNMIDEMVKNYGFTDVDAVNINFYKNYDLINVDFPFTVQLKLDNINPSRLHTVYRLDKNGDIVKCKTTQSSDYIQFSSDKAGEFFILSMDTNNDYQFDNRYEVLNHNNIDIFAQKATIDVLVIIALAIVDEILIMLYMNTRERNKKIWRDYKKSWLNVVLPQEEKPKN